MADALRVKAELDAIRIDTEHDRGVREPAPAVALGPVLDASRHTVVRRPSRVLHWVANRREMSAGLPS